MIDPGKLNYALFNNIPENVKTVEKRNPAILMKAIKNPVEIENILGMIMRKYRTARTTKTINKIPNTFIPITFYLPVTFYSESIPFLSQYRFAAFYFNPLLFYFQVGIS